MEYSLFEIGIFGSLVVCALLVDLYAHKQDTAIGIKSAAIWSAFWIFLALAFSGYVTSMHGRADGQLFLAGYFLEKSLSVDNLFVIMAIFSSFSIDDKYQHRVLYYGIIGALILRFIFIFAGTAIIALFGKPALILFGLFILYTAYAMYRNSMKDDDQLEDYSDHWSVKFVQRFFHVHPKIESHDFFVRQQIEDTGNTTKLVWCVTPLFLCLICIEVADIMFAFDSVPAVIAITEKPFLVYTSNIFAILGLRSLYFLLAAAKQYLRHLEKAVIVILIFIGVKLLIGAGLGYHIPPMLSLGVVLALLSLGIILSAIPEKIDAGNTDTEPNLTPSKTNALHVIGIHVVYWTGGNAEHIVNYMTELVGETVEFTVTKTDQLILSTAFQDHVFEPNTIVYVILMDGIPEVHTAQTLYERVQLNTETRGDRLLRGFYVAIASVAEDGKFQSLDLTVQQ